MPMLAVRIAFFVVSASILVLAHVYLYRRLLSPLVRRPWWRRVWIGAGTTAVLGAISLRGLRPPIGELGHWVALALLSYLGFFVYLLLVVAAAQALERMAKALARLRSAAEPVRLPMPVIEDRRRFLTGSLAAGSAALAGGLGAFGTWRAYQPPQVTEIPIRLPGLPRALDGFSLVQLSDVHVGMVIDRRFLAELVREANALKPDLVAITGDLVDGPVSRLGGTVAALQGLSARYGTYFVTGNHDYYSGATPWVEALAGIGVTSLRNRRVSIGDAGASFDLLGVDDWHARDLPQGYDLNRALAGRDPSRASVLLAHQPSNFDEVASRGVGLQLSGHTHGGQMFPGTTLAGLIWGPRVAGLSSVGNSKLYVHRGCGFVGPPMRVGSPPELARIVLLSG